MGRFSTQYETRSLMVGMLLCIPHGWELSILHLRPPLPIWRSVNTLPQTCAYMSIQPMRKKTSVGRDVTCRHLLKHLDSWIPSPHSSPRCTAIRVILVWSMPRHWGRPCMPEQSDVGLDISLHAYQTLLFHVSRPQSSYLIGNRYNTAFLCLSKESKRQKKKCSVCVCVHA